MLKTENKTSRIVATTILLMIFFIGGIGLAYYYYEWQLILILLCFNLARGFGRDLRKIT